MDNNFDEKDLQNKNNDINSGEVDSSQTEMSDTPTADENKTAEHVISYREQDIPPAESVSENDFYRENTQPDPHGGEYHMTGDMIKDDYVGVGAPIPDYNASHVSGNGNISYTPVERRPEKKKKPKKNGGVAGKVVLVAVCVLLSLGCGFVGAYFGNSFAGDGVSSVTDGGENKNNGAVNGNAQTENNGEVVIVDRVVEHVETSSDGSRLTYADVEALVGDSVVAITTEYKVTSFWQEYVTSGAGSGVIMSEDGYIITNNHVIASEETSMYGAPVTTYADKITVSLKNGNEYEATVIGGDANADIAVIKIEPDEDEVLVSAKFADSDKLKVGEEVIAIGNPLGELSGTTTNGIISALAREVTIENIEMNLLQTNAAINPGNSGGGLFNMSGELVGVVNAKSSGEGIEGLGFAIPSNDAYDTAKAIIENGGSINSGAASVKIGITTVNIFTAADAQKYNVNVYGVYVLDVEEGYNDGVLKAGDRIIAINGEEIAAGSDVVSIVRASDAGDKLEFAIYRKGKFKTVEVTVYANTSDENVDF